MTLEELHEEVRKLADGRSCRVHRTLETSRGVGVEYFSVCVHTIDSSDVRASAFNSPTAEHALSAIRTALEGAEQKERAERQELAAAQARIAELEAQLAAKGNVP